MAGSGSVWRYASLLLAVLLAVSVISLLSFDRTAESILAVRQGVSQTKCHNITTVVRETVEVKVTVTPEPTPDTTAIANEIGSGSADTDCVISGMEGCQRRQILEDRQYFQTLAIQYEIQVRNGTADLTPLDYRLAKAWTSSYDNTRHDLIAGVAATKVVPLSARDEDTQAQLKLWATTLTETLPALVNQTDNKREIYVPISSLRLVLDATLEHDLLPRVYYNYSIQDRYIGRTYWESPRDVPEQATQCEKREATVATATVPATTDFQTLECPAAYSAQASWRRDPEYSYSHKAYLVEVPHAVVGQCGHVYDSTRVYWNDGDYGWHLPCCGPGGSEHEYKIPDIYDKAVAITGPCWPHSFQHFAQDLFGKLGLVLEFIENNPDTMILVAADVIAEGEGSSTPSVEWLKAAGIPTSRMRILAGNQCGTRMAYANKMYFPGVAPAVYPSQGGCVLDVGPRPYDVVRRALQRNLQIQPPVPFPAKPDIKILYIGRRSSSAGGREVKNRDAVLAYCNQQLQHMGVPDIEVVWPEANIPKMTRILSRASIIIAPHGGAIPNIAACAQGTVLIEIVHPCQSSYVRWAKLMGFVYMALPLGPAEHSADFEHVPPARVWRLLQQALEAKGIATF